MLDVENLETKIKYAYRTNPKLMEMKLNEMEELFYNEQPIDVSAIERDVLMANPNIVHLDMEVERRYNEIREQRSIYKREFVKSVERDFEAVLEQERRVKQTAKISFADKLINAYDEMQDLSRDERAKRLLQLYEDSLDEIAFDID